MPGPEGETGLRAVFLAERAALLRLLNARLRDPEEAEEVLQELWLKLHAAPTGPVAQPLAFLFRSANNLAVDRRRSALRRIEREGAWQSHQPSDAEWPGADLAVIAAERLRHVEAALARLPERDALAFRLFRFEELPQKEIAARLGLSLSAVEKILRRTFRAIHDTGREDGGAGRHLPRRLSPEEVR